MKRDLLYGLFAFSLSPLLGCAQPQGNITQPTYILGDDTIRLLKKSFDGSPPYVLLQLHDNETTATFVATQLSDSIGIDYVRALNSGVRTISFGNVGAVFTFDPNRIFTDSGLLKTIRPSSVQAIEMVKGFGDFLLAQTDTTKLFVAIHNNGSDEATSILKYIKNGWGDVHRNPAQDPDDFFITTDAAIFNGLKAANYNSVLERIDQIPDDGSLSVYFGQHKKPYVNVEAEHGHAAQQKAMLLALFNILNANKK